MLKKDILHEQFNLFGVSTIPTESKRVKNILSEEERAKQKEIKEAHRAWKLHKSLQFDHLLTDRQKYLLQKYHHITL
jgi:hypothetical protein